MTFKQALTLAIIVSVLTLTAGLIQLFVQNQLRVWEERRAFRRKWHDELINTIIRVEDLTFDLRGIVDYRLEALQRVAALYDEATKKGSLSGLKRLQIGHPDGWIQVAALNIETCIWKHAGVVRKHEETGDVGESLVTELEGHIEELKRLAQGGNRLDGSARRSRRRSADHDH